MIIPSIFGYFRCIKAYVSKLTPISGITKFSNIFSFIRKAIRNFPFFDEMMKYVWIDKN